jgi:hypothetical protein
LLLGVLIRYALSGLVGIVVPPSTLLEPEPCSSARTPEFMSDMAAWPRLSAFREDAEAKGFGLGIEQ